jgi:hypothetical protein
MYVRIAFPGFPVIRIASLRFPVVRIAFPGFSVIGGAKYVKTFMLCFREPFSNTKREFV